MILMLEDTITEITEVLTRKKFDRYFSSVNLIQFPSINFVSLAVAHDGYSEKS